MSSSGVRSAAVLSAAILSLVCLVFAAPCTDGGPQGGTAVVVAGMPEPPDGALELLAAYGSLSHEVRELEGEGYDVYVYVDRPSFHDRPLGPVEAMAVSAVGEERFLGPDSFRHLSDVPGTELRESRGDGPVDPAFADRFGDLASGAGPEVRGLAEDLMRIAHGAGSGSMEVLTVLSAELAGANPCRADEEGDDDCEEADFAILDDGCGEEDGTPEAQFSFRNLEPAPCPEPRIVQWRSAAGTDF